MLHGASGSVGPCEHGDEAYDPVKGLSWLAKRAIASQEGPCFMELRNFISANFVLLISCLV
jgi:hypothetical protein